MRGGCSAGRRVVARFEGYNAPLAFNRTGGLGRLDRSVANLEWTNMGLNTRRNCDSVDWSDSWVFRIERAFSIMAALRGGRAGLQEGNRGS